MSGSVKSKERDSAFELFRLLLMVMIIIHHSIVHGLGLSGLTSFFHKDIVLSSSQIGPAFIINALCICAVNCFILISGYFKINVTAKKFFDLLLTLLFYAFFLGIVPAIIGGNWKRLLGSILFLSHSPYWFVIDYLILMVFVPLLNFGFEYFLVYKRKLILIGLLVISCYFGFLWGHSANSNGYTIVQFITMYCLGREIAISGINIRKSVSMLIYIAGSLLIALVGWLFYKFGLNELAWKTTYYNNPILIITSVCLFMIFKNLHFHSVVVNKLAKSAFGIYLFQSSSIIAIGMNSWLRVHSLEYGNYIFLVIIAMSIVVSIIAIMFDQLRRRFVNMFLSGTVRLFDRMVMNNRNIFPGH